MDYRLKLYNFLLIENQSEFRPITLNDRLGLGFT